MVVALGLSRAEVEASTAFMDTAPDVGASVALILVSGASAALVAKIVSLVLAVSAASMVRMGMGSSVWAGGAWTSSLFRIFSKFGHPSSFRLVSTGFSRDAKSDPVICG